MQRRGLGLVGGGCGDAAWLEQPFAMAGPARVGCGFIGCFAKCSPDTMLLAAGGVGDGRGLAATPMLGADLVGTRFAAGRESEAPVGCRQAIVRADGEATTKPNAVDVVGKRHGPNPEFVVRVLSNRFVAQWHGRARELERSIDVEHERFRTAFRNGDAEDSGVLIGEVSGSVHDTPPAATIVERLVSQARRLVGPRAQCVGR